MKRLIFLFLVFYSIAGYSQGKRDRIDYLRTDKEFYSKYYDRKDTLIAPYQDGTFYYKFVRDPQDTTDAVNLRYLQTYYGELAGDNDWTGVNEFQDTLRVDRYIRLGLGNNGFIVPEQNGGGNGYDITVSGGDGNFPNAGGDLILRGGGTNGRIWLGSNNDGSSYSWDAYVETQLTTDSSNLVASTAFVKNSITSGTSDLLASNNIWTGTNEYQNYFQIDTNLVFGSGYNREIFVAAPSSPGSGYDLLIRGGDAYLTGNAGETYITAGAGQLVGGNVYIYGKDQGTDGSVYLGFSDAGATEVGAVIVPTQTATDSTRKVSNTAFVWDAIAQLKTENNIWTGINTADSIWKWNDGDKIYLGSSGIAQMWSNGTTAQVDIAGDFEFQTQVGDYNLFTIAEDTIYSLMPFYVDDLIHFNRNTLSEADPGEMAWNDDDGTIDIGMGFDNVVQQVGMETYFRIKNQSGVTINDGDFVMFAGTLGASGTLLGARSDPDSINLNPHYSMGVSTMDITNGNDGYVTHFGLVRGLDTDSWNEGDILWFDPSTTGGLTSSMPAAPNAKISVAAVINKDATQGSLFVRPTIGVPLNFINDVESYSSGSIADKTFLNWNDAGDYWQLRTSSEVVEDIGLASFTSGSVLFADTDGTITEDNANFFYSNAQDSLYLDGTLEMSTGSKIKFGSGDVGQLWSNNSILQLDLSGDFEIQTQVGDYNLMTVADDTIYLYRPLFIDGIPNALSGSKFLVSDSDTVKYRTGAEVWSDINSGLFTQGSVIFAGSSGELAQDNSNLFWDNTNKFLGIGGVPSYDFQVKVGSNDEGIYLTDASSLLASLTYEAGNGRLILYQSGSNKVQLSARSDQDSYINSGAEFGIDITNPDYPLTIGYNSGNPQIALRRSDDNNAAFLYIDSGNHFNIKASSGDADIEFRNNVGGSGDVQTGRFEGTNGNLVLAYSIDQNGSENNEFASTSIMQDDLSVRDSLFVDWGANIAYIVTPYATRATEGLIIGTKTGAYPITFKDAYGDILRMQYNSSIIAYRDLALQGYLSLKDNEFITIGDGGDFHILHDGTYNIIGSNTTQNRAIVIGTTNASGVLQENMAHFSPNGSASLYYDDVLSFSTQSYGAQFAGGEGKRINIGGTSGTGDVWFGSSGSATYAEYGFYSAYNAYKDVSDGNWYQSRTDLSTYMFQGGHHVSGFRWKYSGATSGSAISFTELAHLSTTTFDVFTPVHIETGSAGTVTANTNADQLIVEHSSTGGISILTPDASIGYLMFGSPSDNELAIIRMQQSTGIMTIGTELAGGSVLVRSGSGTSALNIDASQNSTFYGDAEMTKSDPILFVNNSGGTVAQSRWGYDSNTRLYIGSLETTWGGITGESADDSFIRYDVGNLLINLSGTTQVARFDNSGNSTFYGALNIEGTSSLSTDFKIGDLVWNSNTGSGALIEYRGSDGYTEFQINNQATTPATSFTIRNSSGIAHVWDNDGNYISYTSATNDYGWYLRTGSTNLARITYEAGHGRFNLYQSGSNVIQLSGRSDQDSYINSGAEFGIDCTNPDYPLTIGYNSGNNQIALRRSDGNSAGFLYLNSGNHFQIYASSGSADLGFRVNVGGAGGVEAGRFEGTTGDLTLTYEIDQNGTGDNTFAGAIVTPALYPDWGAKVGYITMPYATRSTDGLIIGTQTGGYPITFENAAGTIMKMQYNSSIIAYRDLALQGYLSMVDDEFITMGNGGDFHILHDGTYNVIGSNTAQDRAIVIGRTDASGGLLENMAYFTPNGSVILYYDGTGMLYTRDYGYSVNTSMARVNFGGTGGAGDVWFGASGSSTYSDYGFYSSYNAYRDDSDGNWYQSRGTLSTYMFKGGHHEGGFEWNYSAPVGSSAITFTRLMRLNSTGDLEIVGDASVGDDLTVTDLTTTASVKYGKAQSYPNVVFDGDSRTYGTCWNTSTGDYYATPQPYSDNVSIAGYGKENVAIGGATLTDQTGSSVNWITDEAWEKVDELYVSNEMNIVVIWAGYNDMAVHNVSASDCYDALVAYCLARRAKGWKVIVCTEPDYDNSVGESRRHRYNDLIRENWGRFADGLADLADNNLIGDDDDWQDETYFEPEGSPVVRNPVHMTPTGYLQVAAYVEAAIERLVEFDESFISNEFVITGTHATGAAAETESMLKFRRLYNSDTSFQQIADFKLGRYEAANSYSPNSRLDLYLKDASSDNETADERVMTWQSDGDVIIPDLGGTGSRFVTADANGVLGVTAFSYDGGDLYLDTGEKIDFGGVTQLWHNGTDLQMDISAAFDIQTLVGDQTLFKVGQDYIEMPLLPTSDPLSDGELYEESGNVRVSSGSETHSGPITVKVTLDKSEINTGVGTLVVDVPNDYVCNILSVTAVLDKANTTAFSGSGKFFYLYDLYADSDTYLYKSGTTFYEDTADNAQPMYPVQPTDNKSYLIDNGAIYVKANGAISGGSTGDVINFYVTYVLVKL